MGKVKCDFDNVDLVTFMVNDISIESFSHGKVTRLKGGVMRHEYDVDPVPEFENLSYYDKLFVLRRLVDSEIKRLKEIKEREAQDKYMEDK